MITIALVEDSLDDQKALKEAAVRYFEEKATETEITVFGSAEEYEAAGNKFDLVFLDIMLGNSTGMDLARKIRSSGDEDTALVFVTSLMNYAIEGYSVEAAAYILKPLSYDEFVLKMGAVYKKVMTKKGSRISLSTEDGVINTEINTITYIEVYGHYLTYHTAGKEYRVRQTLTAAETALSDYGFFKISKYYIVNMNKIDRVAEDSIYLGNTELKISRSRKKEFKKKIISMYA